ncbi:serine/Arginine-related protein 53-like [Echinops telfairi]|uniref:Serine/Arginine-related protein 53-like n=1 Tax=Echinops telfairi TaxID=9371 RepID=A0AC55DPB3_ECHTE|nr:serine/Arginine-related protein 53-like [Echinops telfairi]
MQRPFEVVCIVKHPWKLMGPAIPEPLEQGNHVSAAHRAPLSCSLHRARVDPGVSWQERTSLQYSVVNKLTSKYTDFLPSFLDQTTLVEQVKRVKEIEAIESDSFVQQTFRSSKEVKKAAEPIEVKFPTAASGPASVAAEPPSAEKEVDPGNIPTAIKYQDDNSLAHPNLFIEKAEAEDKWFKRLISLRQERLMGSPVA